MFICLYCKINFKRQVSTRFLIILPFFSTGILQLGHGLVVFLIVSLDASSHRACMAACSSTTNPCKERERALIGASSQAANAPRQVKQKGRQRRGQVNLADNITC